jgi:class 3 adenylate cyclase
MGIAPLYDADSDEKRTPPIGMKQLLLNLHEWLTTPPKSLAAELLHTYSVVNYAMFLGVIVHIAILLIFVLLDQPKLVLFNIFSICLFLFALYETRKGRSKNALALASVELMAHAWLACVTIGLDTLFYVYPLALMVLYPVMVWIPIQRRLLLLCIPLSFTLFLYWYTLSLNIPPMFAPSTTILVAAFNLACFSIALAGIMTYAMWSTQYRENELTEEVTIRVVSEQAAFKQLDRMLSLTNFSQRAAQAKSEKEVLELCGGVIQRVSSTNRYELLLVDSNSGPFGTFFERVEFDPDTGAVKMTTIEEQQALRATIARDQPHEMTYFSNSDTPFWFDDWEAEGFQSGVVLPLVTQGKFIGTLSAANKNSKHFSEDIMLVFRQFASVLSAGITLVRLMKDLELSLSRTDKVLSQALPPGIAHRLKKGESSIADHLESAGVFFCDLAGFTSYSSAVSPRRVVETLERIFGILEAECVKHGAEKIKTIGDCFMAVSGVSVPVKDPAETIARFALAARAALQSEFSTQPDVALSYRIGINAGPVYAGIIGSDRLFFDIWGDTVNLASRMERHAEYGEVTCASGFKEALDDRFHFEDRGRLAIKGKGEQHLWALVRENTMTT